MPIEYGNEFNDFTKISIVESVERQIIANALNQRAERVLENYYAEINNLLPQAGDSLGEVIIPWLRKWVDSGEYQKVFDHLSRPRNHAESLINPVATLSTAIVFPWPKIVLVEDHDQRLAESIQKHKQGNVKESDLIDAYPPHYDISNLWTANFYIAGNNQSRHKPGLGIARWPIQGGGFAYAMGERRKNDIPFTYASVVDLYKGAHPEILIEFAEQIKSGEVWENLRRSLQPSPLKFTTPEKVYQENTERAQKYWLKRNRFN